MFTASLRDRVRNAGQGFAQSEPGLFGKAPWGRERGNNATRSAESPLRMSEEPSRRGGYLSPDTRQPAQKSTSHGREIGVR